MRRFLSAIRIFGVLGFVSLASAQLAGQFNYWDVADFSKAPLLLSRTGLYADIAGKTLINAATHYEVNSPQWTDGAAKKRWLILKPGRQIGFKETDDYWDYPDSTVFAQTLYLDTVRGDSASRIPIETRFLILKKEKKEGDWFTPARIVDHWYGFSYQWRPGGLEADRVPDTGLHSAVGWWPDGRGAGKPRSKKKWVFPSQIKCAFCHITQGADTLHGRSVLGFFTAQLNMPSPANAAINQLADLANKGLLAGVPENLAALPRWYGIKSTDPNVTLEKKARAYIAANCSGCHGARGMRAGATFGVDHNYDYHNGTPRMKFEFYPVGWFYGLDTLPPGDIPEAPVSLVTPGYPQKSVILFRQKARNTVAADDIAAFDPDRNQMSPLTTFEADEEALMVIDRWIKEMSQTVPLRPNRHMAAQDPLSPSIHGRILLLPAGLAKNDPAVSMVGIDGRMLTLLRTEKGVYRIPAHLPAGLYVIRVGRESFTRHLF